MKFIQWLLGRFTPAERDQLLKDFFINPQRGYGPLADYLNTKEPDFLRGGRDYFRYPFNVCDDIYGYEVKIRPVNELLDCVPSAYGLKKDQATELYNAILSCVPGSVFHHEKVEARITKGDSRPLV